MSRYEIRLAGRLDSNWSDWFEGFALTTDAEGDTTLAGPVVDQAALHGLLRRIGDLGVILISVNILDRGAIAHPTPPAHSRGVPAMTAATASTRARRASRAAWLAPTGLVLLALIPVLAGAARLTELAGGAVRSATNARFLDSPVPVLIHIASVTVFSLLGALQFVPAPRRRGNRWHRLSGRILIPAGVLAALSGIWMASFSAHPVGDGPALEALRVLFGSAMVASLVLATRAIIRRNFVSHGEWMTRGYAIGMGAGTQAILLIPGAIVFGATHELSRTILMGSAWVINLAVAEAVIRRRARRLG